MKHVVCYSGGEASALVAIEVARRFGTENMILLNHNITSRVEDTDIKRFKVEVADYLGVPITYANMKDWENNDHLDVCIDAKAFKVGIHPLCTNRLKTRPFHEWLSRQYPVDRTTGRNEEVVIYYGFEAHEKERIKRRMGILSSKGYQSEYPLAHWERTINSTRDIGIEPPFTYEIWKHANCTGCLRAGRQHWYVVYCRRRDMWEKAKAAEKQIGYSILKGVYLDELEPKFAWMRGKGIQADEKMHPATFWRMVRKILGDFEGESLGGCGDHDLHEAGA